MTYKITKHYRKKVKDVAGWEENTSALLGGWQYDEVD